jgi:hypothetical protein
MKPITVFCPITRHWALERFLGNLAKQAYPKSLINLCFIVDIDDPRIPSDLEKYIAYWDKCEQPYRSFHVKMNSDWHPNEVHLSIRRVRIADVHNQSKWLIGQTDGEYVIGLEDDTVFDDPDTFNRLVTPLGWKNQNIAFVSGVQAGRHGTYYLGVWKCDNPLVVQHIQTCLPKDNKFVGHENIDAGGMYGYATPIDLYLQHDYFSSSGAPYAVDVNYGLWLRQRGYECVVDWGLLFGHNAHNVILRPDDQVQLIEVNYYRNTNGSGWERKDNENPRSDRK